MKISWSMVCLCVSLVGCNRLFNSSKSTGLVITPGLGIIDVITVKMSKEEISKRTRDLHSEELSNIGWLSFWVPSLGVEWEQEKNDSRPRGLSFYVASDALIRVTNKQKMSRFVGRVAGGPSFEADGGIQRADIVACFGEPLHAISKTVILKEDIDVMADWARRSESYSIQNRKTYSETIVYPHKGVLFALNSNVVMVVNVFACSRPISTNEVSQPLR